MNLYRWRTDAASGEVRASSVNDALARLVVENEWAEDDGPDIENGAWLTIFDADGIAVLRRGTMP